ncbi:MAG: hypothetical protein V4507_06620 [Verrucomicrobiota bacterium]
MMTNLLEKLQNYFEFVTTQDSFWMTFPFRVLHILVIGFFLGLMTLGLAAYYFTFFRFKQLHHKTRDAMQTLPEFSPQNM